VVPAKAGTPEVRSFGWIPAVAGMTLQISETRSLDMRVYLVLVVALLGCSRDVQILEGRPTGPNRLTVSFAPPPQPARPTTLTYHLTDTATGEPIQDLQVLHERLIHTFIVARDFSSFAHIHHEDFAPLQPADLAAGTLRFPYTFPHAGAYRIVSEFTRRDRSWIKLFDLTVGDIAAYHPVAAVPRREVHDGPYRGTLSPSPAEPSARHETELVLTLARDGKPVTDLALLLGAELHVAIWRDDGEYFGHTHSYTPEMAAMAKHGTHSAAMMLRMMSAPAKLIYPGPHVPVRYTFEEPGIYHVFMQCAPKAEARVFHFVIEVQPYTAEVAPLQSIVPSE
jgi:hypothetical protein